MEVNLCNKTRHSYIYSLWPAESKYEKKYYQYLRFQLNNVLGLNFIKMDENILKDLA